MACVRRSAGSASPFFPIQRSDLSDGSDLHHHANYPSQHYYHCPKDVRIFTKHNHTDRYESHQRSEKCAYGTEKFRSINLSTGSAFGRLTIRSVKSERRSINSQVEPNCATNHHDD